MTSAALVHAAGSHAAALLVLIAQASLGMRLLELAWQGDSLRTHERLLFGWVAGFSAMGIVWMVLAATGVFGPVAVGGVLVASLGIAWPIPRDLTRKMVTVLRTLDFRAQLTVAAGLGILALFAWPFFLETLLPNSDWDSALYHLPLAERYLSGTLFSQDPYFAAFSFPGAVHLLYAALLALGLESAIAPLNLQVTGLTLVATVALARQIGGRAAAVWASVAFATTPILWQIGLDARIDSFLAFTIVLGVYAVARFAEQGRDVHLMLAALSLGAAIGCKYSAWPFVAVLLAIGVIYRLRGVHRARGLSRLLAICSLLVAIPNGAWYVANLGIHGDPFFPMLRGDYRLDEAGERIHLARGDEDPAAEWLDDARVKRRLAELAGRSQTKSPTHLLDLVDLLRAPDRYAVKPAHGMGALLLLSLALPLALPARPERRRAAILVGLLGWGSFALLGSQTALLRYAAPALPLLAAATGLVLSRVPWLTLRVAIAAVALVLLVRDYQTQERKLELLQPELVLSAEPSPWRDPGARLAWLKEVGFNFTPPMAHLVEAVAKEHAAGRLGEHCRIFMVGEGKGRLLPCDFLPDASWFAHRFVAELLNASLDLERVAKSLHSRGFTHVLYNRDYYDWVLSDTNTSPARVAFALAHLEHFLETNARPVIRVGELGLFELHTRAAER